MPITYTIEVDAGLIRAVMAGHLTAADYHEYFRATMADPAFSPDMDRLIIGLDILAYPTSAEIQAISMEIRARAARDSSHRIAVVVNTPLGMGMANMTLMQAGASDRFETFPDEPSARAWLSGRRR